MTSWSESAYILEGEPRRPVDGLDVEGEGTRFIKVVSFLI